MFWDNSHSCSFLLHSGWIANMRSGNGLPQCRFAKRDSGKWFFGGAGSSQRPKFFATRAELSNVSLTVNLNLHRIGSRRGASQMTNDYCLVNYIHYLLFIISVLWKYEIYTVFGDWFQSRFYEVKWKNRFWDFVPFELSWVSTSLPTLEQKIREGVTIDF